MNGAQRSKVIFFHAKISKKKKKKRRIIDNFPLVFSSASDKNVPFPVLLQSHYNQSGVVSEELSTCHQKAWSPNWAWCLSSFRKWSQKNFCLARDHSLCRNEPATGLPGVNGFSIQVAFLEVRKCELRLFFLLNHTNILFLFSWVSELFIVINSDFH